MVNVETTAPAWSDDQIVAEYLADKGGRSANTRLAYERDIGAYRSFLLLSYGQEARLAPGDAGQVASFEAWLRDQVALGEVAPATANRRLSALSSFYRWCAKPKRRQVTGVYANPVDADRHKVASHFSDRVLTEAQVIRLIEAAGAGGPRVRQAARDQVALGEVAPATANRRLSALSSFYRWCAKPKRRQVTGVYANPVDADPAKPGARTWELKDLQPGSGRRYPGKARGKAMGIESSWSALSAASHSRQTPGHQHGN